MNELVLKIYNDNRYKSICNRIAKNDLIAEELHSIFILKILETTDDRMIEADKKGYLEVYCVGIIHNVWGKRFRTKRNGGATSDLMQFNNTIEIEQANLFVPDSEYNYDYDYVYDVAKEIIEKEVDHKDLPRMYQARVFNYVHNDNGNALAFSRKTKISYGNVLKTCKAFKTFLKKEIQKYD